MDLLFAASGRSNRIRVLVACMAASSSSRIYSLRGGVVVGSSLFPRFWLGLGGKVYGENGKVYAQQQAASMVACRRDLLSRITLDEHELNKQNLFE